MAKQCRGIFIGILTACLLLLTACGPSENTSQMEESVRYLVSDELSGRLVGTEGNRKAAEFIKSSFAALGLEPYFGESFGHTYEQREVIDPQSCTFDLKLFVDGQWKAAEPGRDFLPVIRFEALTGEFELAGSGADFSEKAILLEAGESIYNFNDKPAPALFLTTGGAIMTIRPSMDGVPVIRLTESGAKLAARAERLQVNISTPLQEKQVENIVGFIPGMDRTRAVVVSAHFDHVGAIGEAVFPGGHDNASGLAVMLEIARALTEKGEIPAADIIFCASNGEENAQQGSAAFVPELSYDWLWNLNIDCVGSPNDPQSYIVVSDTENDSLVRSMLQTLKLRDCKAEYGDMTSDHLSFQSAGYCAVTVGQDSRRIHVPDDDGKDLNFTEMKRLAGILSEYLWSNAAREFVPVQEAVNYVILSPEEQLELQKRVYIALEEALAGHTLVYDEEIYFEVDGGCYVMQGGAPLYGMEEVRKYHPDWGIPETFAGLTFESAYLSQGGFLNRPRPEFGQPPALNTILKRSLESRQDSTLFLTYREGLREMAIQYGAVFGTDGINKESLDGDYRRFTLYSYESINGEFYNEIFVSLNNGKNLVISVQNVETLSEPLSTEEQGKKLEEGRSKGTPITLRTDEKGEYRTVIYDLGNNTREDMIEIVTLLRPALVDRGLLD